MRLTLSESKIFNKKDMKFFAYTWYRSKKKLYINLQQFFQNITLKIYNNSAATAAESAFCNILHHIRLLYREYFRDEVKMH